MFQWLFAEEILSPQDSLKSRTLFAIPHNFFLRNNAFIFFQKSDTIFGPKNAVSHRRISLLPANVLQADLRPSSLNMNVNTYLFSLCVPRPLATVEVSLSQTCFEHFFRPCFRGHDEAGLLAFEALRSSPRPARGQASDAKRNGTRTKRGSRGLESI